MSAEISGVLLVPGADWRERLIGDGPCGSRAPVAVRYSGDRWVALEPDNDRPATSHDDDYPLSLLGRQALALAWAGKPLPDGLARFAFAFGLELDGAERWVLDVLGLVIDESASTVHGRVVLVDAQGREVQP